MYTYPSLRESNQTVMIMNWDALQFGRTDTPGTDTKLTLIQYHVLDICRPLYYQCLYKTGALIKTGTLSGWCGIGIFNLADNPKLQHNVVYITLIYSPNWQLGVRRRPEY